MEQRSTTNSVPFLPPVVDRSDTPSKLVSKAVMRDFGTTKTASLLRDLIVLIDNTATDIAQFREIPAARSASSPINEFPPIGRNGSLLKKSRSRRELAASPPQNRPYTKPAPVARTAIERKIQNFTENLLRNPKELDDFLEKVEKKYPDQSKKQKTAFPIHLARRSPSPILVPVHTRMKKVLEKKRQIDDERRSKIINKIDVRSETVMNRRRLKSVWNTVFMAFSAAAYFRDALEERRQELQELEKQKAAVQILSGFCLHLTAKRLDRVRRFRDAVQKCSLHMRIWIRIEKRRLYAKRIKNLLYAYRNSNFFGLLMLRALNRVKVIQRAVKKFLQSRDAQLELLLLQSRKVEYSYYLRRRTLEKKQFKKRIQEATSRLVRSVPSEPFRSRSPSPLRNRSMSRREGSESLAVLMQQYESLPIRARIQFDRPHGEVEDIPRDEFPWADELEIKRVLYEDWQQRKMKHVQDMEVWKEQLKKFLEDERDHEIVDRSLWELLTISKSRQKLALKSFLEQRARQRWEQNGPVSPPFHYILEEKHMWQLIQRARSAMCGVRQGSVAVAEDTSSSLFITSV